MDVLLEQLENKIEQIIKEKVELEKEISLISEKNKSLEKTNQDLQNSINEYESKVFSIMQSLDAVEESKPQDEQKMSDDKVAEVNSNQDSIESEPEPEQEQVAEATKVEQENLQEEGEATEEIDLGGIENDNAAIDLSK